MEQKKGAWSFREWCVHRGFSPATGYNLRKRGKGPTVIKIGSRSIVTAEADAEWVAQRMAEAAAGNAA